MNDIEKQLKALANRRRLAILKYLRGTKEATVGEIAGVIKLSFKSTSRHLGVLYAANILTKDQRSLEVHYRLLKPLPRVAERIVAIL